MYTDAAIKTQTNQDIKSSKRIYLNHKERTSTLTVPSHNIPSNTTYMEANVYYTNVPLDGKSEADIAIAHDISEIAMRAVASKLNVHTVTIHTKVREKDQAIVSTFSFEYPEDNITDTKAIEKNIWHPLKMETLKALYANPEIGPYVPATDAQLSQLQAYLRGI